jgi:hypothetical protein
MVVTAVGNGDPAMQLTETRLRDLESERKHPDTSPGCEPLPLRRCYLASSAVGTR